MNNIDKMYPLQYQITAPSNWPEIVYITGSDEDDSSRPDVKQIPSGLQNAVRSDSKTGTVRTAELHPSGRQEGPSGRSTLKYHKKLKKILQR
jgi:hypothetical protein